MSINPNGMIIFSVPKLYTFQYPLREILMKWRGVKCYYYTKTRIKYMLKKFDKNIKIYDYGPGYVVCVKR